MATKLRRPGSHRHAAATRSLALLAVVAGVGCVSSYAAADPFTGSGARAERPGSRSVRVAFGGMCGICNVTVDVAGERHRFVDTLAIRRTYQVTPFEGEIVSMTAAPVGDLGPVRTIEIRIDGEVVAKASSEAADGVPATLATGALSIQAVIPEE